MEITCPRESLVKLIKPVARAIPARTSMVSDTWLLLEAQPEALRITGGNAECHITARIEADCAQPGTVAVDSKSFLELVDNLSDADVAMKLLSHVPPKEAVSDHHLGILSIECGQASATFNTMNHHDFRRRDDVNNADDRNSLVIDGPTLNDALLRALVTAKDNDDRPNLYSVNFTTSDGYLYLASSDSTRLTVSRLTPENDGPADWDLIVPAQSVRLIRSLLDADPATFMLSQDRNTFICRTGDFELVTALMAGAYADWQSLSSQIYKWSFTIDPRALQQLVASATAFSHQEMTALRFNPPQPGTDDDPSRIYTQCANREIGSIEDSAPVSAITGAPDPVDLYYNNIKDITRMKLSGDIAFSIPEFNNAINVHMRDNPDFYHLVMPLIMNVQQV